MKTSGKWPLFCLLAGLFSLSSCSGLTTSDQPASTTWWLIPYDAGARPAYPEIDSSVAQALTLKVSVVPGLDSDQILTLSADAELVPFAGARWTGNLPELVGSLIGRTLEASGRFTLAAGRAGAASEVCSLQLQIREFFASLGPEGQTTRVQVALSGRYQCGSTAPLLLRFSVSVPVHDNRMNVIVAAFQQALDNVLMDLLAQLPG